MKVYRLISIFIGTSLLIWFLLPYVLQGIINAGNALGAVFSLILIFYGCFAPKINAFIAKAYSSFIGRTITIVVAAMAVLVLVFVVYVSVNMVSAAIGKTASEATVVVLGCRVRSDGPSLMLSERINAAYEYLTQNPELKCVLSGGKGSDEPISEAECMYNELIELGIKADRLYIEDESTSTKENLVNSMDVIRSNNLHDEIVIITNNFHMYRASIIANKLGISAFGYAASTSLIYFPTYYVRELCGILHGLLFGF